MKFVLLGLTQALPVHWQWLAGCEWQDGSPLALALLTIYTTSRVTVVVVATKVTCQWSAGPGDTVPVISSRRRRHPRPGPPGRARGYSLSRQFVSFKLDYLPVQHAFVCVVVVGLNLNFNLPEPLPVA